MGIMDWFKQLAGESPAATGAAPVPAPVPTPAEDRGAEVGGLNFKSAVDAHMKWKMRLESYINGTSTETLKVDVVCRDDQCPLGKWIYSRGGSEFGYSETFFDMKAHHANFHRCAGEVLGTAQAGDKDKALYLLHHGDYVRASERVKKLLARLFVLVADGQTAIDAHLKWKERLHDYIVGKGSENFDADSIARDDVCALGVWINSEGVRDFGGMPGFQNLRQTHARFHASAGKVVALAKAGRREEALAMLEEGEYAQASDEVTAALVELFARNGR
jgi:hypothetical protein